jgi:CrcB protein
MKLVPISHVLYVGLGGFLGSALRYVAGAAVSRISGAATFPYATLAVNLTGCLAIGCLAGLTDERRLFGPELRLLLFVGLLGGFTTFSTFGLETFVLLRNGEVLRAVGTVGLHVIAGVLAVWGGYSLVAR